MCQLFSKVGVCDELAQLAQHRTLCLYFTNFGPVWDFSSFTSCMRQLVAVSWLGLAGVLKLNLIMSCFWLLTLLNCCLLVIQLVLHVTSFDR